MARIHPGTVAVLAAGALLLSCRQGGQGGDDRRAGDGRQDAAAQARREDGSRQARAAPPRSAGREARAETREDPARRERAETPPAPAAAPRGAESGRPEGALSHAWQGTVEGRVVRANDHEIVLRRGGAEPDLRLRVGPATTVLVDGARSSAASLREGAEVRASFAQQGGEPVATEIRAR